jgi:alkaline phosphatase D
VLANQVMMAPFDSAPGAPVRVSMDQWSGYPAARDRLLQTIAERAPNRTVVLTGDIHSSWTNELRTDFARPTQPAIAAEFAVTSISSGGDGRDQGVTDARLAENPHVRWQSSRRGYLACTVSPETWLAEFRTVPFVTRPDAPLETPKRWRLARGRPGIDAV